MNKKDIKKGLLPYLLLLLLVAGVYYVLTMKTIKVNELTYDKLIKEVSEQNVEKITITPKSGESIYVFDGKLKSYGEDEVFHGVERRGDCEASWAISEQYSDICQPRPESHQGRNI